MDKQHKLYLESLADNKRAYRENLSMKDQALYDYFKSNPAKPKSADGGITLEKALGRN